MPAAFRSTPTAAARQGVPGLCGPLGGVPVAALILLIHGEHAFYWRGYSDKERAAPFRANDLLHRLAIERAVQEGCRFYDMGESGAVSSLIAFKERFGATPRRHPQYTFDARSWLRAARR